MQVQILNSEMRQVHVEDATILPTTALHNSKRMSRIRSSELDTRRNLSRECVGYLAAIVVVRENEGLSGNVHSSIFQTFVKYIFVPKKGRKAPYVRVIQSFFHRQI